MSWLTGRNKLTFIQATHNHKYLEFKFTLLASYLCEAYDLMWFCDLSLSPDITFQHTHHYTKDDEQEIMSP